MNTTIITTTICALVGVAVVVPGSSTSCTVLVVVVGLVGV